MGRKVTDPEGWFADQSSVEPAAGASPAIDPDNYRVTINAHNGYNVYQTNGVHSRAGQGGRHVREYRAEVPHFGCNLVNSTT